MAGVSLRFDDSELQRDVQGMRKRAANTRPAFEVVGELVRTSVVANFEAEGRPDKWPELKPSTLKRRPKAGQILRRQGFAGGLMGSISAKPMDDGVRIGTNKVYAAVHQFGAKKGAFGATSKGAPIPWGDIPARPYLLIQDEDEARICRVLENFILRGSESPDGP
mgnify:FL=1